MYAYCNPDSSSPKPPFFLQAVFFFHDAAENVEIVVLSLVSWEPNL
jgi:hypothetical protein